ncbi:MAG: hypothetical protein ACR2NB_07715 [Solirubrobacteraceae bacterium]
MAAEGVEAESRLSLKPLLDLAGAGAGLVVLIELVGRAVMWARFDAVGLPATSAMSLQSSETLLANGAGALGVAIALGLLAVAALVGIDALLKPYGVERQGRMVLLVVLELILVAAVLEQPASWKPRLLALGTGLAGGGLFWVLTERVHLRRLVLSMFMLIAVVGGVLAFVRNLSPPARLVMASLFLDDGSLTTGAYVALDSDSVYMAPDSFNRTYGELAVIPRAHVRRIALSPPQNFEEAGRGTARALLAGRTVKPPYGAVAPEIARYLAGQSADVVWQYPPLSFLESAYYMSRHPEAFFGTAPAPAVDPGRHVPLEQLVAGAREYSGRPVSTDGIVLRSAQVLGGSDDPQARLITLRGSRDPHARSFCLRYGAENVPVGRTVHAEGVIVNAGTVAAEGSTPVKGIFLQTAGNVCGS